MTDGPVALDPAAVAKRLSDALGDAVETSAFRGQHMARVEKAHLIKALTLLRDELGFDHLSDVTSVDYIAESPRFEVVYNLYSLTTHIWFRLKVRVADGERVPTAVEVFPCANWAEREVYDLMGIQFEGHPSLYRIMLPEGWVGHPLRKDYPMSQITLPRSAATKIPE